ncbi:MAG: hypothetical protein DMG37_18695 [Acidobacteria bacterium]|nr:MAG: hypothetical protein DMG37_18695 [Acidobacteriota bacterium]
MTPEKLSTSAASAANIGQFLMKIKFIRLEPAWALPDSGSVEFCDPWHKTSKFKLTHDIPMLGRQLSPLAEFTVQFRIG